MAISLKIGSGSSRDSTYTWTQVERAETTARKASILLHVIGEEALEIYNIFNISDGERKLDVIMTKFEEYFVPSTNVTYERYKFFICDQKQGVSFDQYYAELLTLAKSCEFGDLKDQLIKDKIVTGIPDNALRERLLREKDLNLDKAVQMCRAAESTRAQAKELWREGTAVHAVKADGRQAKKFPKQRHADPHAVKKDSGACNRCGGAHLPNKCPAFARLASTVVKRTITQSAAEPL